MAFVSDEQMVLLWQSNRSICFWSLNFEKLCRHAKFWKELWGSVMLMKFFCSHINHIHQLNWIVNQRFSFWKIQILEDSSQYLYYSLKLGEHQISLWQLYLDRGVKLQFCGDNQFLQWLIFLLRPLTCYLSFIWFLHNDSLYL